MIVIVGTCGVTKPVNAPYRISAAPLPCAHRNKTETVLKGGAGPDDAADKIDCLDCGAYRWRYCDGTKSDWRKPL